MIIITYYILDFEQAPNCITNMPKRSALEAGLKDLVTPSGKKVRDLLKSVRKRSTSVEVETDDILFLSPLNQVRYNAAEKVDGDKNITIDVLNSSNDGDQSENEHNNNNISKGISAAAGTTVTLPANPTLRLHNEMLNFAKLISPTEEETNGRKLVLNTITELANKLWGSSGGSSSNSSKRSKTLKVEIFGSFLTGLCLPTSDIDIVIFGALDESLTIKRALYQLAAELKRLKIVLFMEVIDSARVPIIKFTHTNGTHADICFDQPSGPRMGNLIRNMLDVVPGLRTLILVLKYFLLQRELNEVYKGGVGSFMLQIMTIASIQYHARLRWYNRYQQELLITGGSKSKLKRVKQFRRDMKRRPAVNLGIMLLEFLEFYGTKLNYPYVGISVRGSGKFYNKKEKNFFNPNRPNMLSIENPEQPTDDLAKSSYRFQNVRSSFAHSFYILSKKMKTIVSGNDYKNNDNNRSRSSTNDSQTSLLSLLIDVGAAVTRDVKK